MIHRPFLAIPIAFASLLFSPGVRAQWQPSQRYPDPLVRVIDPSFTKYRLPLAKVERIATGMRWSEGPVVFSYFLAKHLLAIRVVARKCLARR